VELVETHEPEVIRRREDADEPATNLDLLRCGQELLRAAIREIAGEVRLEIDLGSALEAGEHGAGVPQLLGTRRSTSPTGRSPGRP